MQALGISHFWAAKQFNAKDKVSPLQTFFFLLNI